MKRLGLVVLVAAAPAHADVQPQCHVVTANFVPADQLQIVAWVEKPDGTYVDTIYVTQKIGHFGMGNRPGRFDFNSGPIVKDMWPYGRRTTTFPIWTHRHGKTFPLIVFQNGQDDDLSHPFAESSPEHTPPFCMPVLPNGSDWDAGTCPTAMTGTDKGVFDPQGGTSLYPPRADIMRYCTNNQCDSTSVDMYKTLNPFDAVAQATPIGGMPAQITWPIPTDLPIGDYVLFVEVAKAFDFFGPYTPANYPPPQVSFSNYGAPYRGQPSVVYSTPFTIGATDSTTSAQNYVGYGDPTGQSGVLNPPDSTIDTSTPGSGASRFEVIPGSTGDRLQVTVHNENDATPPAAPARLAAPTVTALSVTVSFVAPGDDGLLGNVTGYDVRYRTRDELTAANFDDPFTSKAISQYTVVPSGQQQQIEIDALLPETDYWIGVRAFDDCHNTSDLSVVHVTTKAQVGGYVDACFVATAAYGSKMAGDVELLRHVRDALLRRSVLGELAVETYYTFGPPVAGVVGESDLLRRAARDVLEPVIARVRGMKY